MDLPGSLTCPSLQVPMCARHDRSLVYSKGSVVCTSIPCSNRQSFILEFSTPMPRTSSLDRRLVRPCIGGLEARNVGNSFSPLLSQERFHTWGQHTPDVSSVPGVRKSCSPSAHKKNALVRARIAGWPAQTDFHRSLSFSQLWLLSEIFIQRTSTGCTISS